MGEKSRGRRSPELLPRATTGLPASTDLKPLAAEHRERAQRTQIGRRPQKKRQTSPTSCLSLSSC